MAARVVLIVSILYTLLITILSLVRLGKISVGDFSPTDKMMHAGAYFVLASCWFFYLLVSREDNYKYKAGFFKVSLLAIAFGMLIEVLQGALTTFREPDWADILANSFGVLVAFGFFVLFLNSLKNVKHRISSFL